MSLLLDALKRAEQEKLAREGEPDKAARAPDRSGFETESPRLAPISAPVLELQPVDNRQADGAQAPAASAEARAVQNAFAAKGAAAPAGRQRMALWAGLGAIVIVVAAAGGYIWYTIQQLTPPPFTARTRPRPPAAPTPPAASAEPSSAAKMEQLVALANAKPLPPGTQIQSTPSPNPPVLPGPAASAPAVATVTPAPAPSTPAQKTLEGLLRNAERAPAGDSFSLQRTEEKPRMLAQVAAGYDALTLGDFERARREYGEAARADPDNIDAQLGLATVEARAGRRALAASLYRHVLEIDPREPTALAGLAALSAGGGAPEGLETQLKSDLARGESAGLHFSLGNLYSGQGRWSEAQAAYFDAHRLDPANADILFNLAVSLDHLGQARLALGYYEQALDMSARRAAQFDASAVSRRVAELRAAKP